jgi:streptogramin lyase
MRIRLRKAALGLGLALASFLGVASVLSAGAGGEEVDLTSYGTVYDINRGPTGQHLVISDYGAQEIWLVEPATAAYTVYVAGRVIDAQEDAAGNIWWADAAATFGELSVTANVKTTWSLTGTESFNGIAFDDSGNVWISEWFGSASKLHRFDPATHELCAYALPGGSYSHYVLNDSGRFWLINWFDDHVLRFDPVTRGVVRWNIGSPSGWPQGMSLDGDGRLWWADRSDRLSRLDPAANEITRYVLPDGAGDSVQMVEAWGGLIRYTESGSGTVGMLNPEAAEGVTSTVAAIALAVPEPTCTNLGAGVSTAVTPVTGTLSWISATVTPLVEDGAWRVYQLPSEAGPYDLAWSAGYQWVTDQGRQKLVRIAVARGGALSLAVATSHSAGYHGDTVTYTYAVTYSSNDGSAGDAIAVADDVCSPVAFVGGDGDGDEELDATETWVYTCAHTLPAHMDGEVDPIESTATVTGQDADGIAAAPDQKSTSVDIIHREGTLILDVAPNALRVSHGDVISYVYTVRYASDDGSPAQGVSVSDDVCSPVGGPDPAGDGNGNGYLDQAEAWIYTCQYAVPAHAPDEANPIVSNAEATAEDMDGDAVTPGQDSASVMVRHGVAYLPLVSSR